MILSYAYIIQIFVILLCTKPCRSGTQSPACILKFTDVFDKLQFFQDGDVIIGGVFTVRTMENDANTPDEKLYRPFQWTQISLLAFLSAIDDFNKDPDILPNITLGYHLYDSLLEPRKAVQNVLQILSGPTETIPNYSCIGHNKLAGVVGDHFSATTIPIVQILGLYRYTQISYGTTDCSLSDRQLYWNFFRTVQNDHVHFLAITKIVKYFGWNWIGILYSDNDTGEKEVEILRRHLTSHGICVAFEKRMSLNSAAMKLWEDTAKNIQCKVLIFCGSLEGNAIRYLSEYSNYNNNIMAILPPAWAFIDLPKLFFLYGFLTLLRLEPYDPRTVRRESLLDNTLLTRHSEIKPLVVSLYNITSTQNGKNVNFQNVTMSNRYIFRSNLPSEISINSMPTESLRAYLAVKAMAEAIHDFFQFNKNVNNNMQLHKFIKRIKNPFENVDRKTFFDENGEFPYYYCISNWATRKVLKPLPPTVGWYTPWQEEDQLYINSSLIIWNEEDNKQLESRCSEICLPGYRKKPSSSIHPCCHDCVQCSEGEISNKNDSESCTICIEEEWPNEKKDQCIPKGLEFLSYADSISKVFIAVSVLLCIVTLLVMGIFIYYLNTPIVKANNRNLSFVLLVCILLSFICVFLFLGHPLDITCILRVMTFGVLFSIAISSLLAKTIIVYIAFKTTKPGHYWKKWIGSKLPNSIVSVCSSLQVIICLVWFSTSRPFKEMDTRFYQDKIVIQCNEGSVIGFYSVLGYMGFLAAISFFLAFMVRTLPDSFNEATYITFSMLMFCSVWITMIPAYLSTKGKYMVAVEVFAILASSFGLLSCIFFPKCFIILFKSKFNTHSCLLSKKIND